MIVVEYFHIHCKVFLVQLSIKLLGINIEMGIQPKFFSRVFITSRKVGMNPQFYTWVHITVYEIGGCKGEKTKGVCILQNSVVVSVKNYHGYTPFLKSVLKPGIQNPVA